MPEDFPPVQGPRFEDMLEDMLRAQGLDDFTPFGDMKQMVVKKKRHGKKVIITFGDSDETHMERRQGGEHEKRIMIYKNGEQGMAPSKEERVIVRRNPGEKVIINEDVDKSAPVNKEKKIIIIREDENK